MQKQEKKKKETQEESYIRRRDWLLDRVRRENWDQEQEKPKRKIVKYKK